MIDAARLLEDLTPLLRLLEDDMRGRCESQPEVDQPLRAEFAQAKQRSRTAQAYEEWRDDLITQSAVHWILGCVFVRFLEDNGLIAHPRDAAEAPYLSGPGPRRQLASDRRTVYFQKHPSQTDREYLLDVFEQVAALPAGGALYDKAHNPLWRLGPTGDGAGGLMGFWQRIEPSSGELLHDFTDPEWNTRFLGDLYQDLSEAARKKYALLQTPEFVEEFILDRTLTPAIEAFGWREVRLIDPACGSGHFLLGAFKRLLALWLKHEPATNPRELTQRALDAVCGVDLNPFAVAIARSRLLVAALRASGIERLKDAPRLSIHVATGDSLLHGKRWQAGTSRQAEVGVQRPLIGEDNLEHFYASEDKEALDRLLGRQYHAVVGNPPYITVKDRALNEAYRTRYGSCYMKYSLAAPFMERFFELAISTEPEARGGFVGMITANSFMKREFGKTLIEKYIPQWDLTHVIDCSGAYIPGHGTPTVVLLGRHQRAQGATIRAVMGIRGEPAVPADPTRGMVWTAIVSQVDHAGSVGDYVSVVDAARSAFEKHPWSMGGGGAAELKEEIELRSARRLKDVVLSVGVGVVTLEDDAYTYEPSVLRRHGSDTKVRQMIDGDAIRDWRIDRSLVAIFPYHGSHLVPALDQATLRWLWPLRTSLRNRLWFRKTQGDRGLAWFEYGHCSRERFATPSAIAYAEVATHNHFALDYSGAVFNQTAPVIKFHKDASETACFGLLGLLNSSTVCFWLKQVATCKGLGGQGGGIKPEDWHRAYAFNATKIATVPVPANLGATARLAHRLFSLGESLAATSPETVLRSTPTADLVGRLREARASTEAKLRQMVALQEELDWSVYSAFGLAAWSEAPEGLLNRGITPAQRPVERLLRDRIAGGEASIYYKVHDRGQVGMDLDCSVGELLDDRVRQIAASPELSLIETPNYKRRWEGPSWAERQSSALRAWLLDRLEGRDYWSRTELHTCAQLADVAMGDADFLRVAALYRDRDEFDVANLVQDLVESEAVPFLPVLRYSDTGLRKRALWEATWGAQRVEDAVAAKRGGVEDRSGHVSPAPGERLHAGDAGEISPPPKYTSADFLGAAWRLRGKLDVPKERFISYPHCERDADRTLLVGWAGWNHLQQAQAVAAYLVAMKEREGWRGSRLTPLLSGLMELQPWLDQWHNAFDAAFGTSMAEYFRGFVDAEARDLQLSLDAIKAWRPEVRKRGTKRG